MSPQRSCASSTTAHMLAHQYSFGSCLLSVVCVLSNILGAGVMTTNKYPGFGGTYIPVNLSVPCVNLYCSLFLTCLLILIFLWSWFKHCISCEVPRVTLRQREWPVPPSILASCPCVHSTSPWDLYMGHSQGTEEIELDLDGFDSASLRTGPIQALSSQACHETGRRRMPKILSRVGGQPYFLNEQL